MKPNNKQSILPVVLAGGTGSRLWPLSRELYPKQLMPLIGKDSLLLETIKRLENIKGNYAPLIICNNDLRFIVAEQIRQTGLSSQIILEPCRRNTAPAAAIAALFAMQKYNDPIILISPADHYIDNAKHLCKKIESAIAVANEGKLITFGIKPQTAETGYGYIQCKEDKSLSNPVLEVISFVEKPSQHQAEQYITAGNYFWNSGMFMFRASSFIKELEKFSPQILKCCQEALEQSTEDLNFLCLNSEAFRQCEDISIDYAIMERTTAAAMVSLDVHWSDVGSWQTLWEIGQQDASGNVIKGDVYTQDSHNNYLLAQSRLLATASVSNCVIVETADAVLVANKDNAQDIKSLVQSLKMLDREEQCSHRKVYRPWGHYELLVEGQEFKVKRITVNPGASLSLQLHHKRNEHWVIVHGIAEVTQDEKVFKLSQNESVYIPAKVKHQLANKTEKVLEIIEVQTGSYLGEDDIVRFEDDYGRSRPVEKIK